MKPGFFQNEQLAELPFEARLLFAGLWCLADREGRLEDRPKRIKMRVFPADMLDIEPLLQGLHDQKLIVRYEADGIKCIWIPQFLEHQNPHHRETPSELPMFHDEPKALPRQGSAAPRNGSAGLNPSSLNPSSLNPLPSGESAQARPTLVAVAETPPAEKQKTATRIPADFALTPERRAVAEAETLPAERTFAKFCDHWRAASGAGARKHDWDATWRNWCRNETDRNPGAAAKGGARALKWRPPPDEDEPSAA